MKKTESLTLKAVLASALPILASATSAAGTTPVLTSLGPASLVGHLSGAGVQTLLIVPAVLGLMWASYEVYCLRKIDLDGHGDEVGTSLIEGEKQKQVILSSMKSVAASISEGASAFLFEQYKFLAVYMVIVGAVIGFLPSMTPATMVAFLIGSFTSALCGYVGMKVGVFANVRTCHECWIDLDRGFTTAIRGGMVMGLVMMSLAVLNLFLSWVIVQWWLSSGGYSIEDRFAALAGYGLGGSSIALFARVAGGIYTKAADVGADLSGKNEYGMEEDDPRNPACIADNVGDNVGDVAGMGADLFGSFAESTCASLLILSQARWTSDSQIDLLSSAAYCYPLLVPSIGIISGLGSMLAIRHLYKVDDISKVEPALKLMLVAATVAMSVFIPLLSVMCYPDEFVVSVNDTSVVKVNSLKVMGCTLLGLWGGLAIGLATEYYTSNRYRPVQEIAETQRVSAATGLIFGLSLGYMSCVVPIVVMAVTALVAHTWADMYGTSLAAIGMLSTLPVTLTVDGYGPISDNAGGIAEMSHMGSETRRRTDALDAAGNTSAAIGKGFAIGSAALVALSLFGAFCVRCRLTTLNLLSPWTFTGMLLGTLLPFVFSALTMKAVGRAAQDILVECLRQFPKIVSGEAQPDYAHCIGIATRASISEMVVPGLLVVLSPIVAGMLLGSYGTAGLLIGALCSGIHLAISMSNSGGAWDNAKKYIEAGNLGRDHLKGSATHKNAVTGDTVGDPLKDTSGPSINILIKLSAITSVMFGKIIYDTFTNKATNGPIWASS